jgi:hypothetical protein
MSVNGHLIQILIDRFGKPTGRYSTIYGLCRGICTCCAPSNFYPTHPAMSNSEWLQQAAYSRWPQRMRSTNSSTTTTYSYSPRTAEYVRLSRLLPRLSWPNASIAFMRITLKHMRFKMSFRRSIWTPSSSKPVRLLESHVLIVTP